MRFVVDFYYGSYMQTVEFLSETLANNFFEDVKKNANKVTLTKIQPIREFQQTYDSGLKISFQ